MPHNEIKYEKFKLDNGIKCVIYPRKEIHSVQVRVVVNVGSLDENKKTNGLSHFIEHVVHDGTRELLTWDAIDNYTNEFSGSTNAYTSIDHTQYYGVFPYQYLEQSLYYFSQIVFAPLFKESDINKERDIILDEQKRSEDEIDYLIYKNIKQSRFMDFSTPFSFDVIGEKELLKKYSRKSLINFYNKYYVPQNVEIYMVGNIDIDNAKKLLGKYFEKNLEKKHFKEKPKRNFKLHYPEYSKFKIKALQKRDISQYYLTVSFPTFEFINSTEEEREIEKFLKSITASSQFFQSILWKRLREELGIVYGIGAYTYDMNSRSVHIIQTSFDKKYINTVLQEIYKGIEDIKNNKISKGVFNARKKRIIDTHLMQLDYPDNMMNWIISYEDELETHGRALGLNEYLKFVENLKYEKVIEVANKIYNWDDVNINIVSQDEPRTVENSTIDSWSIFTNGQANMVFN